MLHHARNGSEAVRQPLGLGESAEMAVEDHVAAIGNKRAGTILAPAQGDLAFQPTVRGQPRHERTGRTQTERVDLDRQRETAEPGDLL